MVTTRFALGQMPAGQAYVQPELDDARLMAALRAGEMAALDALYSRYHGAAFATALALLRETAAAEDVVHDAFLRAWRSAASFQAERGSLRAWLMTVVRNTAIDHLRARQLAMRPQPRLAAVADGGSDADPLATVAIASEARRLREAMAGLPEAQRLVLELAFFAGLTHGEIAARTGAPLGTVKGRLRLGLGRLRQTLGDLAPESGAFPRHELTAAPA
jgi:RNA polymerase sigma-70 factor (ECF subfamily)